MRKGLIRSSDQMTVRYFLMSRKKFFIYLITIVILSTTISLRFLCPTTETLTWHMSTQADYHRSMNSIAQYRLITYGTKATKYRWLFLTSLRQYKEMMDRHYFEQFYAAQRHPNIEAVLWGVNFPDFKPSLSIIDNIQQRFGSPSYFDVIYELGSDFGTKDIRLASRYSPIMAREHECWGYRCLPGIIDHNISIMLHTYAYEIDLYHKSFSYNRVIIHSPHAAESLVYYPPVVLKTDQAPVRDIDLLVIGAQSKFVYPLRARLGEMVQKGLIKNSHLQAHPGYRFSNHSVEQTEAQTHTYAAFLRRAKIVVVDSSRYGYALSKYMQVALSGCLIIGDIPAEREDEFRRFVVEISMNMTDAEILSIIDYWLRHDNERQMRAAIGQQIALNSYTWDHSIDLSLQALIRYRRGEYGIYHQYPYSLKCVPLDNTHEGQPTATSWCRSGLKNMLDRVLCECNKSSINYIDNELDLDNWKTLGDNVNASNPHMYLVPRGLVSYCDSHEIIVNYAQSTSSGAVCHCQKESGSAWSNARICYLSNTILTIARHLVYCDTQRVKASRTS